jgi:hypothetical protein
VKTERQRLSPTDAQACPVLELLGLSGDAMFFLLLQHNQRVWKEIEACINTIKGQILTQIPYQQIPVSY